MLKRTIIFVIVWLSVMACIEKIEVSYNLKADLLTIDGFVFNGEVPKISIAYSRSNGRNTYLQPVKGSTVELLIDGQSQKLTEGADGVYSAPNNVFGTVGKSYQLKFKSPDGRMYESTVEKLGAVPPIDKIYHTFNRNGGLDPTGKFVVNSTTDVFLDFQDPEKEQNNYLWKTTLWERQDVCLSCTQSTYNITKKVCEAPRVVTENTPSYDYACNTSCWDIIYNREILVQSDNLINGKKIVGRLLQQVPFYRNPGGLLEVQQLNITATAYRYFDLLRQQSQTTGTLTDTPPAPLVGNVRNLNDPTEVVVGFFTAAGMAKTRYWIDRLPDYKNALTITLLGRTPEFEPPSNDLSRPPLVPCENGPFRTPFKPAGWVQ